MSSVKFPAENDVVIHAENTVSIAIGISGVATKVQMLYFPLLAFPMESFNIMYFSCENLEAI